MYTKYMVDKLRPRRLEFTPFVKRVTNNPRNKTNEYIWERPDCYSYFSNYFTSIHVHVG